MQSSAGHLGFVFRACFFVTCVTRIIISNNSLTPATFFSREKTPQFAVWRKSPTLCEEQVGSDFVSGRPAVAPQFVHGEMILLYPLKEEW